MRLMVAILIAIAVFEASVWWDGDGSDYYAVGLWLAAVIIFAGAWLQSRKHKGDCPAHPRAGR